jgi:hypothetical protein
VALFLLDRFEEAKTVLTKAHDLDPSNETIATSLEEVNAKIKTLNVGRKRKCPIL